MQLIPSGPYQENWVAVCKFRSGPVHSVRYSADRTFFSPVLGPQFLPNSIFGPVRFETEVHFYVEKCKKNRKITSLDRSGSNGIFFDPVFGPNFCLSSISGPVGSGFGPMHTPKIEDQLDFVHTLYHFTTSKVYHIYQIERASSKTVHKSIFNKGPK